MKAYLKIFVWLQSLILFSQTDIGTNGFQFEVSDTDINTEYSEIGTGFFRDKLILVSSKKIGALAKIDPNTNEAYKELYCLDTLGSGNLSKPILFSRILNTDDSEGQVSFSPDEQTVYYTRSNRVKSLEYKLYRATFEEGSHGNWMNEELLSFNSENVSIENPFVNARGDKLYFSANMPDALGGFDIYSVNINPDGTLGIPENLGEKINTTGDDKHPYMSADNKYLFFASNGHEGMGGFDFFASKISNNEYRTPKNMGNTINTSFDEIAYFNANDSSGYFSSNRNEGNSYDLHYFTFNHIEQTVKGKVLDTNTNNVIAGTVVILRDKNQREIEQVVTDNDGSYSFDVSPLEAYTITTQKSGYDTGVFDFRSYKNEYTTYTQDLALTPTEPVIAEVDNELRIIVENIYFDYGQHSIKEESNLALDKIVKVLNEHPKIKLVINAHTDNVGSYSYNLRLSKKRAKSTLNYLIENGIDKNRLLSKGYGEQKPLIDCKRKCTNEEAQANRRVEFVILNASPENTLNMTDQIGDYHVIAGSFNSEKNGIKLVEQLKADGFVNARSIGKNNNGLLQVAYASYKSKPEATRALETIRIINNEQAWLTYKRLH